MKILKIMAVAVVLMIRAVSGATMDVIWQTPQQQTNRLWYSLNNGQWAVDDFFILNNNQWIQQNQVPVFNFRDILMQHLRNQGTNCLKELGRLMLAQSNIPNHNYNVQQNNSHVYINANNGNDLPIALGQVLKSHILQNGHLGYFPVMGCPIGMCSDVSSLKPRGIFNLDQELINNIMKDQRLLCRGLSQQSELELHFLPNILRIATDKTLHVEYSSEVPVMTNYIENKDIPNGLGNGTLFDAINRLLTALFSSNTIQNVRIVADAQNNNRFTIDFNWIGGAINGATDANDGNNIGVTSTGYFTNTIRVVVDVMGNVISIISIFPQG